MPHSQVSEMSDSQASEMSDSQASDMSDSQASDMSDSQAIEMSESKPEGIYTDDKGREMFVDNMARIAPKMAHSIYVQLQLYWGL